MDVQCTVLIFVSAAIRQKRSTKSVPKNSINLACFGVLKVVLMKIPSLVGYYTVPSDEYLPMFRRNQMPSFSESGELSF
jgi:hypothetical protein